MPSCQVALPRVVRKVWQLTMRVSVVPMCTTIATISKQLFFLVFSTFHHFDFGEVERKGKTKSVCALIPCSQFCLYNEIQSHAWDCGGLWGEFFYLLFFAVSFVCFDFSAVVVCSKLFFPFILIWTFQTLSLSARLLALPCLALPCKSAASGQAIISGWGWQTLPY